MMAVYDVQHLLLDLPVRKNIGPFFLLALVLKIPQVMPQLPQHRFRLIANFLDQAVLRAHVSGLVQGAPAGKPRWVRLRESVKSRRLFTPKGLPRIARRFNAGSGHRTSRSVPEGRLRTGSILNRPFGTKLLFLASPALKRRAIVRCPSGTNPPGRLPDASNRTPGFVETLGVLAMMSCTLRPDP
jgi:hypothetical protein